MRVNSYYLCCVIGLITHKNLLVMKQEQNPAGIIALLLVAVFATLAMCLPKNQDVKRLNIERHQNSDLVHICADTTHKTCDGVCICDGMECK
jgi:hypothetical protein